MTEIQTENYLKLAIEQAKDSICQGGFPAGAILVKDGKVIGRGIAIGNKLYDPTCHPEIDSIRQACKSLQITDLSGAVLYASLQPCLMCLGAAMWASINKIFFACAKDKVSADYYGGSYEIGSIVQNFISPIDLVHIPDLENDSLSVVHEWERSMLSNLKTCSDAIN